MMTKLDIALCIYGILGLIIIPLLIIAVNSWDAEKIKKHDLLITELVVVFPIHLIIILSILFLIGIIYNIKERIKRRK